MSEKSTLNALTLLEEAERCMKLDEAALIEEIKRRRKLHQPGIPAEKAKKFRKLLRQEFEETGTLNRARVVQLLQQLLDGEL
jgi:hypothetical protein